MATSTPRLELSPANGRPPPSPEPLQAAILNDRSLAVRFDGGPWIRPTAEEIRLYGEVLGSQPADRPIGEWFFQCPLSGKVRFTNNESDKQNARLGSNDEEEEYRRLFEEDIKPTGPKIFTSILGITDIKRLKNLEAIRTGQQAGNIAPPASNSVIPVDVMPIDIAPTPFAHAYSSRALATMTDKFPVLSHVNCSYLSTFHHAPTLLELKQHAQALTVLIYEMSGPSTNSAQVDNENLGTTSFQTGEPFDWLNNLSKPYTNLDAQHSVPLTTLMNTYHHDPKTVRTTQICPLSSLPRTREAKDAGQPGLPYMTHEELTKHANECLEILDHEFSAEGGLLAILPDMEKVSDRGLSGTTILGQLILFTQRLVQRVHELELRAANAADLLSGEKVIPRQMLGLIPGLSGREGTRPRPVSYPQDKYVLANAGDQAWDQLTKMLNVKEKRDRDIHNYNVQHGLSASSEWQNNRMMEFRSGMTHIDVMTRYTRVWDVNSITGAPTPIFIIPGHAVHPGITETREMESNPHVVQVIKPQYPERLSVLEDKYEEKKWEYEDIINEHRRLKQDNIDHLETIAVQQLMYKDLQAENSYRRAEQQGRGVEDLAKFRNPIAEKEKMLDETQRDLDRKLTDAELAARDTQKNQEAAQAERTKLENWKTTETIKIQTALERNGALTASIRAGYLRTAGTVGAMAPPGPPIGATGGLTVAQVRGQVNKYGETTTGYEVVDITDVPPLPAGEPYPDDLNGTKVFVNEYGEIVSQNIFDGIVQATIQNALPPDAAAYVKRVEDIEAGRIPRPPATQQFFVLTSFPGAGTYLPGYRGATGQGNVPTNQNGPNPPPKPPGNRKNKPGEQPSVRFSLPPKQTVISFSTTSWRGSGPIKTRTPPCRPDGPVAEDSDDSSVWRLMEFGFRDAALITVALKSLGWEPRYDTTNGANSGYFEWFRKDSNPLETLGGGAWRDILLAADAPLPAFLPDGHAWSTNTMIQINRAMMDAGFKPWLNENGAEGYGISWTRAVPNQNDEDVYDGRQWLIDRNARLEGSSGIETDEEVIWSMTGLGFTLNDSEPRKWIHLTDSIQFSQQGGIWTRTVHPDDVVGGVAMADAKALIEKFKSEETL